MNKFCLMLIIFLSLGAMNCGAQSASNLGLSVSPQIFELDVFQGQKIQKEITIRNLSDVPLPILVKVTDFTAEDLSGEMEFDESLQDPIISSKKWFKIENPNFILNPGEKEIVKFEILIPENAEPGGHYSVILFEPQLPSFYFPAGQPKAIPVVGVLFEFSVKSLSLDPAKQQTQLEIAGFIIPNGEKMQNLERLMANIGQMIPFVDASEINILEKAPSEFSLSVKNSDIFHHKLSGNIFIYNLMGKRVGESEIKNITILPGKIREFPIQALIETPAFLKWMPASISNFLSKNTSFGKYKVILELGEEKNQIELQDIINFWVFPWKMMILFSVLIVLIVLSRKRIIAAAQVIFHRN